MPNDEDTKFNISIDNLPRSDPIPIPPRPPTPRPNKKKPKQIENKISTKNKLFNLG